MPDLAFIIIIVSIVTALIYFLYLIMLGSGGQKQDVELQITEAEILQHLNLLYKQRKLSIVESLAKKYLKNKSENTEVRFVLAKALFELGETQEAIEQIKVLLQTQPNNSTAKFFLVNCYEQRNERQKGIDVLKEILLYDAENAVALKIIANLYNLENQKITAIKMYNKLISLSENSNEIANTKKAIAAIYLSMNDCTSAINEYKSILELYPEDISVRMKLIEVYSAVQNYSEVINISTEILNSQLDEEWTLWVMKYLMNAFIALKEFDKAIEIANLIKNNPVADAIEADENIAKILGEQNQLDESIEILLSLISQQPQNVQLRKNLAKFYIKKKDYKEAVFVYKDILKIVEPREITQIHIELSELYSSWAEYLFGENNLEECFKMFTTAIQYYEKNPDVYYRLGNINKRIKNFNEAISLYKKALEFNSKNALYYESLAECYEEMGSIYEQKRFLLESLNYNKDSSTVNYKLGLIAYAQNDLGAAVTYYQKAIAVDNSFVDAKCQLALLYEHIGQKENAITLYEEILKAQPQNEEIINNLKMLKAI